MCLATPCKIKGIKDTEAVVESGDHTHTVDLSLIKNAEVGEYLLVHADMAINKVPKEEAIKIIKMIEGGSLTH